MQSACRVLGVSRSGYYASRRRLGSKTVCATSIQLRASFMASGKSYGSRRLKVALQERGIMMGRYRVRRLMREQGLKPVWRRKFVHTTDSRHNLPVFENVLARQFNPDQPDRAWVSDLTYIQTRSGWLYLAVVLDLYSRKVVGWAMAPTMPAELVCSALQMAIMQRNPSPGLIVHSDQGSQYASDQHTQLLDKHGLIGSMSRKGNCWDNAVMERFFLNLKMERVWQQDYANHGEAIRDITEYIVAFYNTKRMHSTLGYMPPTVYEAMKTTKQPIGVSEIT